MAMTVLLGACGPAGQAGGGAQASPAAAYQGVLARTWSTYKGDFIQADGRVIDHQRGEATTSEGQSYALLRAAWMDDRETFERVWSWDAGNLRSRGDRLLAYLWGRRPDGGWG